MIKEFLNTDKVTFKLAKVLAKIPISADAWTWLAIVPAIIGFFLVITAIPEYIIAGIILFLLSGFMDGIDGGIARIRGKPTKLGAFMDGTLDRFVDFMVFYSFVFLALPAFILSVEHWVMLMIFFGIMPSFICAYANHRGAVDDPGEKVVWRILHRAEMIGALLVALLVSINYPLITIYILVAVTILSVITTFQSFGLAIYKSKTVGEKKVI
ncbi:MAG: CDP-alcohol phosphatidyltransferase family protein, partial [Candidatus Aenigmatarchaeota archaeon]